MAKTKVSEFDAVASNNTDINSVNVAEGCPPSGINNAIREMASLLKKQEVGTDAMTSPDINGGTIDGATIGGSSGVTIGVSDGTVSAPSIKFTSDTNTGIYRGGTDILKFVTAGTDAVTIDASQLVGINNSSPSSYYATELVVGTSDNGGITLANTNTTHASYIMFADGTSGSDRLRGQIGYDHNNDSMFFGTNATQRINISSGGNISFYEDTGTTPKLFWDASAEKLGIGSSSPVSELHVQGAGEANIFLRRTDLTNKAWLFNLATDGNLNFKYRNDDGSADGTSLVLDRSGNLLLGTTNVSPANGNVQGIALKTNNAQFSANANNAITLNRMTDDGNIVKFKKAGTDVGNIGNNGTELFIGTPSGSGGYIRLQSGGIVPATSTGANSDGTMQLGTASGRFSDLYLSGGVYLGGTGSANYLDDYEEGTWSPTITAGTATFESAKYTKVGRIVHVIVLMYGLSDRSTVQNIEIGNLPFTSSSTNQASSGSLARYWSGGGDAIVAYVGSSNVGISLYNTINSNNYQRLRHDHASHANTNAYVSLTYETSA